MEKEIVRKYTLEVINTGNVERISEFIDENYVEEYNEKRYILGIEGAIQHVLGVRKTYPDLNLQIKNQICEGEWVATSYTMTGTHSGEWMGIKPTNKMVQISGINLDRVINGKIVEHSGAANMLEPLLEIGAIKIIEKEEI
ncbi:MAG: ester cyclase [Bacteroidetes bacterium]|nr:MAG: ester cyclase [Bacteroidota bacterium]